MFVYHNIELRKKVVALIKTLQEIKYFWNECIFKFTACLLKLVKKHEDCSYNVTRYKFIVARKEFKQQSDLFEIDLFQMHL